MIPIIPKYFTTRAIILFFALQLGIALLYMGRFLPFEWYITGNLEVVAFFYFSNVLSTKWVHLNEKTFVKRLFVWALLIRVIYVAFSFFFYQKMTGQPFEFETGDALGYHEEAVWIKELMLNGHFSSTYLNYIDGHYSDAGYPFYLSLLYMLFNDSIFLSRLVKAILSAYTCVLLYKIARNNFGEETGKMTAVLSLLFPGFIYYCGIHLKETEMIFLVTLFVERTDSYFKSANFSFKSLALIFLIGLSFFFFRTVLGITAFFSILTVLVFSNEKLKMGIKRFAVAFWIVVTLLLFIGGGLQNEILKYWEGRETNQVLSLAARAEMVSGNRLAKYGKSAVFAPFMLIAPFPTMVNIETQQNQMMNHGTYYVKNVLAFFVFLALILLYKEKKIRKHLILVSFMLMYLVILALSKFAISERFHMPVYPFLIIFAAYGVSKLQKTHMAKYNWYLVLLVVCIVGWNWFKLAGRGEV